jgi:hypothetical protein
MMAWTIKVIHTDKEGTQLACHKEITDILVEACKFDVRIEFFKEMLADMDTKLKEKNT